MTIPAGANYHRRFDEPPFAESYNFVRLDFSNGTGTLFSRRLRHGTEFGPDTESAENGAFTFMLPTIVTPERHAASQSIVPNLAKGLQSEIVDEMEVSYAHSIETLAGREWSRWDVARKIKFGSPTPRLAAPYPVTLNASPDVAEIFRSADTPAKPLRALFFRYHDKDIKPTKDSDDSMSYEIDSITTNSILEYRYVVYDFIDEPFKFQLNGFCRRLRFEFKQDPGLEYPSPLSLGGMEELKPTQSGPTQIWKAELSDWSHPGQGYLLRCRKSERSPELSLAAPGGPMEVRIETSSPGADGTSSDRR
jgi:hypothetical protein